MNPGSIRRVLLPFLLAVSSTLSLLAAGPAPARERPSMPETLDHKAIHERYNEGDFDFVISALESFMRRNRRYSLEDSVFIAKHLAVVYTANPATREKGRYHMHRLLELLPSARLVDMYVSEEIDRVFDKVREEFLARRRNLGADTTRTALATTAPARAATAPARPVQPVERENPKGNAAGFWIAGGAAVLLAGTAAVYFVHQGEEASGPPIFRVADSVTVK